MRLLFPFFLLSFFAFSSALPVDVTALAKGNVYEVRDLNEVASDAVIVELEKKDIAALTFLFKSLNNSATIGLAKTALSISLTQTQVCNFVGAFIETKGLSSILKAADQSGLGLDLVLMVLTHYETISGVTKIVKQYKGTASSSDSSSSSSSSSSSGGLLGGLGDLLGLGNLFGSSSTSLLSSQRSGLKNSTSSTDSSGSSDLSSLLSDLTGTGSTGSSNTDSTDSDSTDSSNTPAASNDLSGLGSLLGSGSDSSNEDTAVATTAVAMATNVPATAATVGAAGAAPTAATAATVATTDTSDSVLDSITSILKRDDLAQYIEQEGLMNLMKRDDVDADALMDALYTRAIDEDTSELERRDLLTSIYSQIIGIIGTNSNIESIFESLQKSGLAINVVYNAIMDSGFYKFDIKLFNYLVDEKLLTLSGVVGAAISSGFLTGLIGDIVNNSAYTTLVINFVLGIFTGKVPLLGLITALF